ncbi:sigma 54-interacting transcriptional regulator [uncultured Roseivirga sp.]|uniref:sigma 54-interacting transcriptional regulator n=2 Tax=Roseivirga TaxID=290180 RepID=UPI0025844906|nr:sigma 54-interacting transcriptional regulator [uncultured Roseivirga sp.]MEC7755071.1 sigma 54-interacting transcriptional regulator [Bacteroidota bacterium]
MPKLLTIYREMSLNKTIADHPQLARFTVERALAAILWMDEQGCIHFANKTALEQYGYSSEEFNHLTIFEINPNFDRKKYAITWARSKQVQSLRFESSHLRKDGSEFPVEIFVNHIEFEGHAYNVSFIVDISQRKRHERLMKSLSEATAATLGTDFFKTLVERVSMALNVHMVVVTECTDSSKSRLRTLAYFKENEFRENVEYNTEGTPCGVIMESKEPLLIERGTYRKYIRDTGVEGYFGVPIINREGEVIGHIALFNNKPLLLSNEEQEILKIFSDRAAAEIERNVYNNRLVLAMQEVKNLKDRLEAENVYLQEEIQGEYNFEEIITQSDRFKAILTTCEQVAVTDATVLILGESGTGKELLARAIHNISKRRNRPLVKVNCAALPANLIESELFGHEKGAFTGAINRKIGRFELAHEGTLFLDEIGELPLELQSKLLRALQEGEFERLGSTETIKVDVRVIAATNRQLDKEVEDGHFRADLFYRLNVFPVHSLPLRERKEDIALLVKYFTHKFAGKLGKRINKIPKRYLNALQAYDWPGNIRELENVIERAVILSPGHQLELGDWIPKRAHATHKEEFDTLEAFERKYILEVLQKTAWRVSGEKGAAKILGMKPTTLESRMKKLGIKRGLD